MSGAGHAAQPATSVEAPSVATRPAAVEVAAVTTSAVYLSAGQKAGVRAGTTVLLGRARVPCVVDAISSAQARCVLGAPGASDKRDDAKRRAAAVRPGMAVSVPDAADAPVQRVLRAQPAAGMAQRTLSAAVQPVRTPRTTARVKAPLRAQGTVGTAAVMTVSHAQSVRGMGAVHFASHVRSDVVPGLSVTARGQALGASRQSLPWADRGAHDATVLLDALTVAYTAPGKGARGPYAPGLRAAAGRVALPGGRPVDGVWVGYAVQPRLQSALARDMHVEVAGYTAFVPTPGGLALDVAAAEAGVWATARHRTAGAWLSHRARLAVVPDAASGLSAAARGATAPAAALELDLGSQALLGARGHVGVSARTRVSPEGARLAHAGLQTGLATWPGGRVHASYTYGAPVWGAPPGVFTAQAVQAGTPLGRHLAQGELSQAWRGWDAAVLGGLSAERWTRGHLGGRVGVRAWPGARVSLAAIEAFGDLPGRHATLDVAGRAGTPWAPVWYDTGLGLDMVDGQTTGSWRGGARVPVGLFRVGLDGAVWAAPHGNAARATTGVGGRASITADAAF